MRSDPILVIGFGGAGLRTLDAFDAMFTANHFLVRHRRENIYYFAVDTDKEAIQAFQQSILWRGNGAEGPYTTTCCLSQGIQNFDEIVHPVFDRFYGRPDDTGLSRLREHWWFDADGRPFHGWDGLNVMHGSGVSPAVAFTLAWRQMRMIEEKVGEILDNMRRRTMDCEDPISRMRIYFVTSLAGGTGRGSWAPVMLKVKEVLSDRCRRCCQTTGLFFDASIFGDLFQWSPNQSLAHKVNSLTGLSELSFWMDDDMRGMSREPISVRLPDMVSPTNPEKDVLKFGSEEKFLCPRSPVDNAYLICGQSSAYGRLAGPNEYFQMAGRAIFTLCDTSDIEASLINDSHVIRSFATAALQVDAAGLGAYFNYLARKSVLDGIFSRGDDVDARIDQFLERIFFPVPIREELNIRYRHPDLNGTLMQLAWENLNASKAEEYLRLRKHLPVLKTSSEAKSLFRSVVDSVTETDVSNAVSSAVEFLSARFNGKGLDLRRELVSEVQAICRGNGGEKLSVGRVRKFLQQLLQKMDDTAAASFKGFSFYDPLAPDSADKFSSGIWSCEWIDRTVAKFSRRTLGEVVFGRPLFNMGKVEELVHEKSGYWTGIVPYSVLCAAYPRLIGRILEFFKPLWTFAREILDSCDHVWELSRKVDAVLSVRLLHELDCRTHDELFHRIFTTPDQIFCELPSVEGIPMRCQTVLKPIVEGRQEVEELLSKSDSVMVGERLCDLLLDAIDCGMDNCPRLRGDGSAHKEYITEGKILEAVMGNVNVPVFFVEKEFSLLKVLARNRKFWNRQIRDMSGSADVLHAFCDRLGALFSLTPEWSDPGELGELPSAEDLLVSATCTLVRRCQPWWNIDRDAGRSDCYVVAPTLDLQLSYCGKIRDSEVCRSQSNRNVIILAQQSPEHYNPYNVVVLAMQDVPLGRGEGRHPFDVIKSFEYWKEPEILEKLREAERTDGKLIFSGGGRRGLGYISPRFVQNPQLSSMRWKPWAENKLDDEIPMNKPIPPIDGDPVDSTPVKSSGIFISYSRKDLDMVRPIVEELRAKGFSCWMDIDGIESGDDNFKQKIVPAIDGCCVVLFFISAGSQKSEWTAKELGYAKRHGKRVVPLRFNDAPLVGVFDFDYGDADVVDWRRAEQRAKLLINLKNRMQKLCDVEKIHSNTDGESASKREDNHT